MNSPEICILKTDGINCDEEMKHAFEQAGAQPSIVHINQLRGGDISLGNFGGLVIPGGFSYGDDIASGKVLANELTSFLSDELQEFADQEKPILGVCNGMQVLVRTGLLPDRTLGSQTVTMAENDNGHFERRWIELKVGKSVCKFAQVEEFVDRTIPMEIAHGKGRFVASSDQIAQLVADGQVVFSYARAKYVAEPYNPNGSMRDIAGICDSTGLILGMMPHPERSIAVFHPYRRRTEIARNSAAVIFNNFTNFAQAA